MRLTHFGHACVVIEHTAGQGGAILIDPGSLADDLDAVGDIDAILITHEHPDHLDAGKLSQLRKRNAELRLFVNAGTEAVLDPSERERAEVLDGNDAKASAAGIPVRVTTTTHATIYSALPDITNNAYLVDDSIWHPGDAFVVPPMPVDVLLLPIGGPWMKLAESIDYLRQVAPKVAVPIHQGGLGPAHRQLHVDLLRKFAPSGTEVVMLESGTAVNL